MFKKNLIVKMSVLAAVAALSLAGCTSSTPETKLQQRLLKKQARKPKKVQRLKQVQRHRL